MSEDKTHWQGQQPDISQYEPGNDLSGADLRGVDLSDRDFGNSSLRDARLEGACLANANLAGVLGLTITQLSTTDLSRAKLPDDVDVQAEVTLINDSIRQSRTLFVAMLTACALCLMALAESTDGQLLAGNGRSSLPVVNASVSTRGFFVSAPFLIAAVFVYFQLYLQQTWARLAAAPIRLPSGQRLSAAVLPWLPVTVAQKAREERAVVLGAVDRDGRLWWGNKVVDTLLYIAAPITVFTCWGHGVALHDVEMTTVHATVVALTIGFSSERYWRRFETLNVGFGLASGRPRATKATWLFALNCGAVLVIIMLSYLPLRRLDIWRSDFFYHPYIRASGEVLSVRDGASVGVELFGRDLRGAYLPEADLSKVRISGCDILNADLTRAKLNDAVIIGLTESLSPEENNVRGRQSKIIDTRLRDAQLDRVEIMTTRIERVDMRRASLRGADVSSSVILGDKNNFTMADFSNARFRSVDVQGPDLNRGPDFSDAVLDAVTFSNCGLLNVRFREATARCVEFDEQSRLENVTFFSADLRGASFAGAVLRDVSFRHADLRHANFKGATLVNVDFRAANVGGADFRGVKRYQTNLPRSVESTEEPFDCEDLRRSKAL